MGKSIGAGFQEWSALDAEPALLDEPVRPLVTALNRTGWARTIFSCAGHPEEPDSIKTGRRQAHVDVVISDQHAWKSLISAIRRTTQNVRITEAPLGPIPNWLTPSLPASTWHYRRLVFEPVPYNQPPEACRATLDTALAAATNALESPDPHTSHANTH